MTILEPSMSLERIKKIGCVGSCGYAPASVKSSLKNFFLIIFKLIQQSNMVILSCLAKKNENLNSKKKSSVYY